MRGFCGVCDTRANHRQQLLFFIIYIIFFIIRLPFIELGLESEATATQSRLLCGGFFVVHVIHAQIIPNN